MRFPDSEDLRSIQFQKEFINLVLQDLLQRFTAVLFPVTLKTFERSRVN